MMLGSIPQQDVFQRVMSARNSTIAARGPVLGGSLYFLFARVPMFIVASAVVVMGDGATALLKDDPQKVLPTFIMQRMSLLLQIPLPQWVSDRHGRHVHHFQGSRAA